MLSPEVVARAMSAAPISLFPDIPATTEVVLPEQFAVYGTLGGNLVMQLRRPARPVEVALLPYAKRLVHARLLRSDGLPDMLLVDQAAAGRGFTGDVLAVPSGSLSDGAAALGNPRLRWISPKPVRPENSPVARGRVEQVRSSWSGGFDFRTAHPEQDEPGLRTPQLGALFAMLAHWTIGDELATVAMPTGSGKTDTMIAVMVQQQLPRLLVVVPTSALRDQITNKFLNLGVLPNAEVVAPTAELPVVGKLEHGFASGSDAEAFFAACNVVVATMPALNACSEDVRRVVCECCSHLFIDEAHHVTAPSWEQFRRRFGDKPIVQFTATPFRNDGKHIGGRMIYCYPLHKAQEEGYFTSIRFRPVYTFVEPDRAIASEAVAQLREDLDAGLDHLVMARVNTIARAKEVVAIYQELAAEFLPVILHSEVSGPERKQAVAAMRERSSRIIVCVDMLGEGFDLPHLKIAALHDIHKSLAITLQFTGRFTRSGAAVGEATMIANRALLDVQQRLRALYAEDPDWNRIIRELGAEAVGAQVEQSEFMRSFSSLPAEVPIQTITPKMSTVVYRTTVSEWTPEGVYDLIPEEQLYTSELAVSEQHKVLWFVTREASALPWTELRELENVVYHLYLLHWDAERGLLFINSSNLDTLHEELARSVGGPDAARIHGPDVYRAMHGINRLIPTNMGLIDVVSRTRRFQMLVGADVTEGFEPSQTQSKAKTNLFGYGFEGGERITIGCAQKGRIWSHLAATNLSQWMTWCHHVGGKLIDETISLDEVFKGFIKPVLVKERPPLVPLAIEWPAAFLAEREDRITVAVGGTSELFFDVELTLENHEKTGPIIFRVEVGEAVARYEVVFGPAGTTYKALGPEATISLGKRSAPLSEWFHNYAPKLHFEQDTFIEHDLLMHLERTTSPFDPAVIQAWDWTGVDLKKEAQGPAKVVQSIQRRVIEHLLSEVPAWDIIYDDDAHHEIADVVALRMADERLIVHLFHCKFSQQPFAGCRLEDLYPVCGQAQKSVAWRDRKKLDQFIPHLVARDERRIQLTGVSRFERGDLTMLAEIAKRREVLRPEFTIHIVQPGLSQGKVTAQAIELLAATSLYLHETYNIGFRVIASP